MGQTSRIRKNNTTITKNKFGTVSVTLYATEIVKVTNKYIQLNSGNFKTVTTKKRMNEVAEDMGLNYRVWQQDGQWFVAIYGQTALRQPMIEYKPFKDGMKIRRFS